MVEPKVAPRNSVGADSEGMPGCGIGVLAYRMNFSIGWRHRRESHRQSEVDILIRLAALTVLANTDHCPFKAVTTSVAPITGYKFTGLRLGLYACNQ